jgi:ribA/ribD-fused uncharacterized protein
VEQLGPIDQFTGEYYFLSNFWVEDLEHRGVIYASSEHAFQARKAVLWPQHEWVRQASTPGIAKRRGAKVEMRRDWDTARDGKMLEILRCKFAPGTVLAGRLEATGTRTLVEGNTWGDQYWGVCRGVGKNKLGMLLQQVRAENRAVAGGAGGAQDAGKQRSHADEDLD